MTLPSSAPPSPADVPRLQVVGLSKTFTQRPALDHVDLTIRAGEVHTLVGENGSGKSTLIKILSGYHTPDPGGSVYVDGEPLKLGSAPASAAAGFRFVHQNLGLVESLSVVDNLSLGSGFNARAGTIRVRDSLRRARRDLAAVGLGELDPRTPVGSLPAAARTGVAVARALRSADNARPARILVLDEPTATLPYDEVENLLDIVRSAAASGIAVLYITHRLDEIFEIGERVTVLRDGRVVAERPVAELDRAQLVGLLVGTELEETHLASAAIEQEREAPVLEVRDVATDVLDNVSLDVAPGEIVGVAGITGSGRDVLLATLFGARPRLGGKVGVAGSELSGTRPDLAMSAGMGYLPPDRALQGAVMSLGARENLSIAYLPPYWRRGRLRVKDERRDARAWFQRLSVRPDRDVELPLSAFSGGNQQKILFAKWLQRTPLVLLLDEPTQGVDIGAKAELHARVVDAAAGGAAVLVSSTDVDELVALCHRVLVMRDGRIVAELRSGALSTRVVSQACLGVDEPTKEKV